MKSDKEIKKWFREEAGKNPEKYYPINALKEEGFKRKRCSKCGKHFWTTTNDDFCGEPACSNGYTFLENNPAKNKLDYIGVWKEFSRLFKKWGYTPIDRYPVVARWRDDTDFVQASIYDFQPYVVSGEIKAPADMLVVPQFSLRFNDIDNVGITGAHYTGFVMIGQHVFLDKKQWNQEKYFKDIHNWLKIGIGLPNEEIKFHEDAWAGGGNFGPCVEFFSRGLELGNQVYTMFEQTPSGNKELKLKVLDMGMGQERNAWFTQGKSTSYETTFPTVTEKLYKITGIKPENELMKKFLPYSSFLNIDEVDDIEKVWKDISKKTGYEEKMLKDYVLRSAALYSVAEHSRALLFALNDGALPSNVGGGYNLRVILRRALGFIDKNKWDISLPELCEWHAEYLKPIFPELMENLEDVKKILEVEKKKYIQNKDNTRRIVQDLIQSNEDISENKMMELYDSKGISPETIKEEASRNEKKIEIPENFYAKIAEMHEKTEQITQTHKLEHLAVDDLEETQILYYDHFELTEFKAKVLKILKNKVILDKTAFYPTSGGQLNDRGTINKINVTDVFKQGNIVIHVLEKEPHFKKGDEIEGNIDYNRRLQLAQHHTATHIINGAARKILGNHVWQNGASKTEEKARLDITHYDQLTDKETNEIEKLSNEIIKQNLPVYKNMFERNVAESKYGFRLYQGGAVPGKIIRVIEIPGFDIEACGGTHLNMTGEAIQIKLLKTSKIQDGIVRIEFVAGYAAEKYLKEKTKLLEKTAELLDVELNLVPKRVEELFEKWKAARKLLKKEKVEHHEIKELELKSKEDSTGNLIEQTAKILNTQPEHIYNTVKRFLTELEEMKNKLKKEK
jgi:alanyl-tRNA synthetase